MLESPEAPIQTRTAYTETRYTPDARRDLVWRLLAPYLYERFQGGRAGDRASVLDVGCGFGGFVNHVPAAVRTAVDRSDEFAAALAPGVRFVAGEAARYLDAVEAVYPGERYDMVFSSNVLEHLSRPEIESFFAQTLRALNPGGRLVLLLPNYARAPAAYFDDYTHLTPLSHTGMTDWLVASGFRMVFSHPGFMPFSVKTSRVPITAPLVRAWLRSPFKPFGKQMLLVAEPHAARP